MTKKVKQDLDMIETPGTLRDRTLGDDMMIDDRISTANELMPDAPQIPRTIPTVNPNDANYHFRIATQLGSLIGVIEAIDRAYGRVDPDRDLVRSLLDTGFAACAGALTKVYDRAPPLNAA